MYKILQNATEELAAHPETNLPDAQAEWWVSTVAGRLTGEGMQQLAYTGHERVDGLGFQTLLRFTRSAWRDLSRVQDLLEGGLYWLCESDQKLPSHVAVTGLHGANSS